uniref:Omp28-related outer membrane protein n=1 Tax=candidate division WOR-3 bacterium TaxID=2052148 RepID=A0A7V5XZJ8_UNCW3
MKRIIVLLFFLISLKAYSAERNVLAEDFTGTWCPYCPGAQMGLRNLKNEVGERVVIIAYHYNGRDPFYIPETQIRGSYYGVIYIPTVWFDGVLYRTGGSPNQPIYYGDLFSQRATTESPIIMDLNILSYNQNTGVGQVKVHITNELNTPVSGYLRCAMVGLDTFYYWQTQESLFDVCLGMFPNGASGELVTVMPFDTLSRIYNFTIPAGWRYRRCSIAAFLQDDNTHEVQNAKEVLLPITGIKERLPIKLAINLSKEKVFNCEGKIVKGKIQKGVYFIKEGENYKKVILIK